MKNYRAVRNFYLGDLFDEADPDFCRIKRNEIVGALDGDDVLVVKGRQVQGTITSALPNLTFVNSVPDPKVVVGGASAFLDLDDVTVSSYAGLAGRVFRVNATETDLEPSPAAPLYAGLTGIGDITGLTAALAGKASLAALAAEAAARAGADNAEALTRAAADAAIAAAATAALSAHTHAGGANGPKLVQANTHESPDTDVGPTSLHHTLGNGANQAIKGTHSHSGAAGEGANLAQAVITNLVTNRGELALEQDAWRFDDAANETLRVEEYARYAKTLVSVAMKTSSGTCTAKFQIGGVDVTSLTALAVNSGWQVFTATALNAVLATGNVDLVLTNVVNMPKLYVVILYTKTLT